MSEPLNIALHDYSGHPFQVQLSRELARRGHRVSHFWCLSYSSGKGALAATSTDPAGFTSESVDVAEAIARHASWRRIAQELAYGRAIAQRALDAKPDVVVSANNPLFAQQHLLASCRRASLPFVFWQQDIYSEGMRHGAEQRLGKPVGAALGRCFSAMEGRQLRRSDGVVAIADDFLPALRRWRVDEGRTSVIENWAPLDELPERSRGNEWATRQGLVGKRVALYSGTLGMKHNPELILEVARRVGSDPDAVVVVVSQGRGAEWLKERARREQLESLRVLPFQPYESLPDVLGSADVLLAVLEGNAGVYSVPSKILTYHCAGRAIVAAVPSENLAARTIRGAESGKVIDPADEAAFADAVVNLLADVETSNRLGANGRAYAVEAFAIDAIADRFELVLQRAIETASGGESSRRGRWRRLRAAWGSRLPGRRLPLTHSTEPRRDA